MRASFVSVLPAMIKKKENKLALLTVIAVIYIILIIIRIPKICAILQLVSAQKICDAYRA